MTTETITNRIKELQQEQATLASSYNQMTQEYQRIATAKQTRYAQVTGAIAELTELKKQMNGAESP